MRRHRKLLLIAALTIPVALTLSVYLLHPDPGPACRGHTLKEWLVIYSECKDAENLVRGGFVHVTPEDIQAADKCRIAREAIKQTGTKALPYLLSWIDYEDHVAAAADKLPDRVRKNQTANRLLYRETPGSRVADLATDGFMVLGPQAKPARPALVRLMNDAKRPDTSARAIEALAYVGTCALPDLLSAISNRATPNRELIAGILRNIPDLETNATQTETILRNCLSDADPEVVIAASDSLRILKAHSAKASPPTNSPSLRAN